MKLVFLACPSEQSESPEELVETSFRGEMTGLELLEFGRWLKKKKLFLETYDRNDHCSDDEVWQVAERASHHPEGACLTRQWSPVLPFSRLCVCEERKKCSSNKTSCSSQVCVCVCVCKCRLVTRCFFLFLQCCLQTLITVLNHSQAKARYTLS